MAREMTVRDSVSVAADPLTIWTAVADPSQMARWSPENIGAEVPAPGSPLSVGDSFVGVNKRGRARWRTRCVVTASDPGQRFAFDVRQIGLRKPVLSGAIASWEYTFAPTAHGTDVTETWTDARRRWPDALAAVFDRGVTGGRLFSDFQRRNIARTLAKLKADFED